MKKLFVSLSFLVLLAGCQMTDKATLYAARDTWAVLAPEYTAYVAQDAKLDDASKATRTRTAELLTKLLTEVK